MGLKMKKYKILNNKNVRSLKDKLDDAIIDTILTTVYSFICPYCQRPVPNNLWFIKDGCKWCKK